MSSIIKKTVRRIVSKETRNRYVKRRNYRELDRARKAGKRDYLFTVIIPVYNAETYLSETVESLINQTIGFENIQLILINDGSKDGSEDICKYYASKYENVEYHFQENSGVSAARNHGLNLAKGLYINFLDSDDKWDNKAFEEVVVFLSKYGRQKLLAAKEIFFDGQEGEHPRNYIFKKDKVCHLEKNYTYAPVATPQCFFRYDAVEKLRFNENLKHSEDALFTTEIMLEDMSYGVMSKPVYYYRKHSNNASSSNLIVFSEHYYTDALTLYHDYLINKTIAELGSVPKFIQYELAYNIGWRVKDESAHEMDSSLISEYIVHLTEILQHIGDDTIEKQRHIGINHKLYMLAIKYGWDYETAIRNLKVDENMIVCDMEGDVHPVQKITRGLKKTQIEFIHTDTEKGQVVVEGSSKLAVPEDIVQVFVEINGKQYDADVYPRKHFGFAYSFDDFRYRRLHFRVTAPLDDRMKIRVLFSVNNSDPIEATLTFGRFVPLNEQFADTTYGKKKGFLYRMEDGQILLEKMDTINVPDDLEEKYCAALEKDEEGREVVEFRKKYFASRDSEKKLWIFTDRMTSAEDSGEVMFKYVNEHPIENVETAFLIRDDVPDYKRLKEIGRVIPFNSEEYKLAVLEADMIISSAADDPILNPFKNLQRFIKDLYTYRFVFLQHGVIKDDLSGWLHRANKNIELFVTSAEREKQSIIDGPYGYSAKEVVVTGLPRFDNFIDDHGTAKDNSIYVMPTWREWLAPEFDVRAEDVDEIQKSQSGFQDSSYFKFYNNLLKNEKLHELLEKNDYNLYFALHPRMGSEMDAFYSDDRVHLLKPESFTYGDAFKSMSLLITDYSSVAFNVALLNKPVIYAQFDYDEFYLSGQHTSTEGYFSYENDGFGPVVTTPEAVVQEVEELMERDFVNKEVYQNRIKDFFYYPDDGASRAELVYREILKMG